MHEGQVDVTDVAGLNAVVIIDTPKVMTEGNWRLGMFIDERSWRDGRAGSLQMGIRLGAWCVGCCWALMASLLALGIMSIAWMAFVAALIAAEKTLPWRRVATYTTAGMLLALGLLVLAAPDAVPALTIPGPDPMQGMEM